MHRLFQSILSQIEKVFWLNDPVHSSSKMYRVLWNILHCEFVKIPIWTMFKVSSLFIVQNLVIKAQEHSNNHKNDKNKTCFNIKLLQWNLININVQIRCTVCPVDKASLPCTYFTDTTGYLPQGDFHVTVRYSEGLLFRRFINPKMKNRVFYFEGSLIQKWKNRVSCSEGLLIQNWNMVHYSKGSLVQN